MLWNVLIRVNRMSSSNKSQFRITRDWLDEIDLCCRAQAGETSCLPMTVRLLYGVQQSLKFEAESIKKTTTAITP
jgi:hypothetical protein